MGRFDKAISKVTGVALMVALVVVIAGLISVLVLTGFDLKSTSSAGVTLDQGEVKVIEMGNSEKLLIKENGTVINQLNSTGESMKVNGGEKIIAVTQNGNQNLLKTITKQQVRESGGKVYKDPTTLSKDDVEIVKENNKYSPGDDRLLGTTEKFKIKFKDNYDPEDFQYNWGIECGGYSCNFYRIEEWSASTSKKVNEVVYEYSGTSSDTAKPKVNIKVKETGKTYSLTPNEPRYHVRQPIKDVKFESQTDHYSNGEDRIQGTQESWRVTNVTLHPKVSDVLEEETPETLSDYKYNGWGIECGGYSCNFYRIEEWSANTNENKETAVYEYTSTSSDTAEPRISIEIPEIGVAQGFSPSTPRYHVRQPIKDVKFESQTDHYSNGEDRIQGTQESWRVTNVTLHPKVSDVLEEETPETLSDYKYNGWGIECGGYSCNFYRIEEWSANVNENKETAVYEYTSTSSDTAEPRISIEIPEIGVAQGFSPSTPRYHVRQPIKDVKFETNFTEDNRKVGDSELWRVTNVTLHPKVSDALEEETPETLSDYKYNGWGIECGGYSCNFYRIEEWSANVNENKETAVYEYTSTGSDAAKPRISIEIPEIGVAQGFSPSTPRYPVE